MYRARSKYHNNWCLRKLRPGVLPSGSVPCGGMLWQDHVGSKPNSQPETRYKGAQCRISQVLRSLVYYRVRRDDANAAALSPTLISAIYEGQDRRFYGVHPLELASRKKYYRTHFLLTQTISYFQ